MIQLIKRLYCHLFNYFWLPCPVCGKHFGGFESGLYGQPTSINKAGNMIMGRSVCRRPSCQAIARAAHEKALNELFR